MGTVGGVKAQRIHSYITHMFFFATKILVCTKNREFSKKKKKKIDPLELVFLS